MSKSVHALLFCHLFFIHNFPRQLGRKTSLFFYYYGPLLLYTKHRFQKKKIKYRDGYTEEGEMERCGRRDLVASEPSSGDIKDSINRSFFIWRQTYLSSLSLSENEKYLTFFLSIEQ